jgi:hypothetical protein
MRPKPKPDALRRQDQLPLIKSPHRLRLRVVGLLQLPSQPLILLEASGRGDLLPAQRTSLCVPDMETL